MDWRHFKKEEFDCRCGCGENLMDDDFIDRLDTMRAQLGFVLIVSSGYRCPKHNRAVSTTGDDGPHTTGRAVDFAIMGVNALELVHFGFANGMTGIGVNQRGPHAKRFVHMDDLAWPDHPRPNIWSY